MKKFAAIIMALIAILIVVYFAGPKPDAPKFETPVIQLPDSLEELEKQIVRQEKSTVGLKPDNEARIIWADSSRKIKTKVAILYIHGFTASPADGTPIKEMAKKFGANAYLFRNAHHGVDLGDSTMIHATADDYIYAAERALAIAEKLGDQVIVVGASLGGALSIYLASRHPEIKAIILYAPGIISSNDKAALAIGRWGFQIAKMANGSAYMEIHETNPLNLRYFSNHFHLHGAIAALNFIFNAMTKETFQKVKCPVLLSYWYKNEKEQDDQVSAKSMQEMFSELGTPSNLKRQKAFPNAGNHTIGSYITSKDYMGVEREAENFIQDVVLK